jgi:hypothetical protein
MTLTSTARIPDITTQTKFVYAVLRLVDAQTAASEEVEGLELE